MMVRAVCLFALVGCVSCGAKQGPAAATAAGPTSGEASVERPPDLSPVPAPADLVLVGRLGRPRTLVETLAGWAGMPLRLGDVLPPEMKELEHVVAWDAPVELAGVLDRRSTEKVPAPLVVLSIGLTSIDKAVALARDEGTSVTQVAPGVFRASVDENLSCAISASLGVAPARLVCGDEWKDVEELLPYATRGLPTRDLGPSDLYVELTAEPIRRRYTQEISSLRAVAGLLLRMASLDDKRFDRVLTDVAYGLADELKALANEAETIRVTAKLDEQQKVLDVAQSFTLRNSAAESSFLSQVLRDVAKKAAPPPDTFWQLPANASTAAYAASPDPARLLPPLQTLIELADAYLEYEKVSPALRKRTRRVLEAYSRLSSAGAFASGPMPPSATPLPPLVNSGWSVGTIHQRADAVTALFTDLSALLADPQLGRVLRTRLDLDPKLLPRMRTNIVKVKGFEARATAYRIELSPALLAEMQDAADMKTPQKAAALKPVTISLIVVPDGERSVIASAQDEKLAIQLLETLRAGTDKTLATVPELQPLRSMRAVWGGYWTLENAAQYVDALAREEGVDLVTRMPNHGRTPWLFRLDVTEAAPGLTVGASFRVPQGAFQDVGSLIPAAAGGLLRQP